MNNSHQDANDNREIFIWKGRDPAAEAAALADAIAPRAITELFYVGGVLTHLRDGQFVPVTNDLMREVVARHIKTFRFVNQGTAGAPRWEVEFHSFEFPLGGNLREGPDRRVLINLIEDLAGRVARGPTRPIDLSNQQLREIEMRLRESEPMERIARAYGVDVDTIKEVSLVLAQPTPTRVRA
jgi:hypothetical protein